MVGVYFLMEDLDVFNQFDTPPVLLRYEQSYTQKTRTGSVFGTGTWDFFDDFTLDASVRYSWEYKELDIVSTAIGPGGGTIESIAGVESKVFDGVTGFASLEYRFTDTKNAYVKYTRGWKPGHFNGGAVFTGTIISPVEPETVDSFEGGFKTSWFDGRLELAAAAFFYMYKDMQIFQQQPAGGIPIFQLINAQEAEILGVEASLNAEPIEGLKIRYEVGWLDSEYPDFVSTILRREATPPGAPKVINSITADYTGNRLLASPDWSMSGSVEYSIPLPLGLGALVPRFSFSWQDDIFYDPAEGKGTLQELPDGTIAQKDYWLLHGGLLWRNEGDWLEVSGWVRNITDEAYRVQSFDLTDDFQFVADYYGDPRTYGFTVSLYF
jgi:iron complex outermembrane receptor protein